jgi:hypothetical protein
MQVNDGLKQVADGQLFYADDCFRCNGDIHPSSTFVRFGSPSASQLLLNR